MHRAKLLYVEDDLNLGFVTQDNLQLKGFEVKHFENGKDALADFIPGRYDLCILDVMLPKMDGYELAKKIREQDENVPIIFLTAKSLKEDRLKGLRIGADDYLTKPFSIEELLLKIEVFLKRSKVVKRHEEENQWKIGGLTFNFKDLVLHFENSQKTLTYKEAELLKFFVQNSNRVLKRDDILNAVWGDDDYFNGRSMDVFISRLRGYLKEDDQISIKNVHGVGFVFQAEVTSIN